MTRFVRNVGRKATRAPLVIEAFVALTSCGVALRLWPEAVIATAERMIDRRDERLELTDVKVGRITGAVARAAGFHPFRPQCLEQALAARTLLRRRHIDAHVVLGVARHGAVLAAHAWIEIAAATSDPSSRTYQSMVRF